MMNYHKVNILMSMGCDVIENILDEFGVQYSCGNKRISGPCPIHEGDNGGAFNMYHNNNRGPRGLWMCYTQHCEKKYGKNLLGFIRGLLSKNDPNATYSNAIVWLCTFLGISSPDSIEISPEEEKQRDYISTYSQLMKWTQPSQNGHWGREKIIENLQIPAQYYIDRGYSRSILERYDVGFFTPHQRVVVPVYDDGYRFAMGYTKRAVYPEQKPKWLHSDGFNVDCSLYNFWFSRNEIKKTKTAIIVEGPGDVWRLEENGIHNSVAIFKNSISEQQINKLLNTEIMSLVVLLDNDPAGMEGTKQIYQELSPFVRLFFPTIQGNDIGSLKKDHITNDILPLIQKVENIYSVKTRL